MLHDSQHGPALMIGMWHWCDIDWVNDAIVFMGLNRAVGYCCVLWLKQCWTKICPSYVEDISLKVYSLVARWQTTKKAPVCSIDYQWVCILAWNIIFKYLSCLSQLMVCDVKPEDVLFCVFYAQTNERAILENKLCLFMNVAKTLIKEG